MKFRLPRKLKKQLFKRPCFLFKGEVFLELLSWRHNKNMVITRNYLRSGIYLKMTPERDNWIRNGLLKDYYWNKKFNYELPFDKN